MNDGVDEMIPVVGSLFYCGLRERSTEWDCGEQIPATYRPSNLLDPDTSCESSAMNDEDLIEIYRAKNAQQATLLKNLLEDEGIDAQISNQGLGNAIGESFGGWSFAPQILVRRRDVEHARALANDWDERLADRNEVEDLESHMQEQAKTWDPPLCLACKEPRHVICPHCETSGTDFEPAEFLQADGSGGILTAEDDGTEHEIDPKELRLMCTVCDKSFQPQYLRHCPKCGYDFRDGVELSAHASDVQFNGRAIALILAMLALGVLAAAYFFFVVK